MLSIKVNDVEIMQVSDDDITILANDLPKADIENEIIRRIQYIVSEKINNCQNRLFTQWLPSLRASKATVPTDTPSVNQEIYALPDYKDRDARDAEKQPPEPPPEPPIPPEDDPA